MPHIVPDRRRFYVAREKSQDTNTSKSYHKLNHHRKHSQWDQHGEVRHHISPHTPGTKQKHSEMHKDAYSIPHPVPPKITPRARMVPATAPMSLLVAMFTVWRENGHFLTGKYTLISLTYKSNLFRKYFESKLNLDVFAWRFEIKIDIYVENIWGQFWIYFKFYIPYIKT